MPPQNSFHFRFKYCRHKIRFIFDSNICRHKIHFISIQIFCRHKIHFISIQIFAATKFISFSIQIFAATIQTILNNQHFHEISDMHFATTPPPFLPHNISTQLAADLSTAPFSNPPTFYNPSPTISQQLPFQHPIPHWKVSGFLQFGPCIGLVLDCRYQGSLRSVDIILVSTEVSKKNLFLRFLCMFLRVWQDFFFVYVTFPTTRFFFSFVHFTFPTRFFFSFFSFELFTFTFPTRYFFVHFTFPTTRFFFSFFSFELFTFTFPTRYFFCAFHISERTNHSNIEYHAQKEARAGGQMAGNGVS